MQQRVAVLVVFGVSTLLTLMLMVGHGASAGDPILTFQSGHGLNSGDVVPLALWSLSGLACVALWRRAG